MVEQERHWADWTLGLISLFIGRLNN